MNPQFFQMLLAYGEADKIIRSKCSRRQRGILNTRANKKRHRKMRRKMARASRKANYRRAKR